MNVTVDPLPTANAGTGTILGSCLTQTYVLNASATGTMTRTYSWSPATYLSATNILQPTFTSGPSGTFTYTLTVTDKYGCTATSSVVIVVDGAPTANAGPGTTLGICNKTYVFAATATGTATVTYAWSPATYLSATNVLQPTFTSSVAGTFTYTLTVTDKYGCTATSSLVIVVDPAPTANAGSGTTLGICGKTYVLNASATGTATLTYSWSPATYLSATNVLQPTFTSSVAGTFTYTLTVTDKYGCTATSSVVIVVDPAPTANAGSGTTLGICSKTYVLNATASGTQTRTYSWSPSTYLSASNILQPTFTSVIAGSFTYTLTVTDKYGCTATSSVVIVVDAAPTANAGTGTTLGICGKTYVLAATASGTATLTYSWSPATYLSATNILQPTFTSAAAGSFTYTLTVTDKYGCTATSSVVIVVDPAPTANAGNGTTLGVCSKTYVLNATASGTQTRTYSWSPAMYLSATNILQPTFTSSVAGTFTYTLTVTDKYGCTATSSVVIVVAAGPTANAGADQSACNNPGYSVSLVGVGTGSAVTYGWAPATYLGGTSTSTTATFSGAPVGTYTITLTVTDSYGCTAKDDVVVTVKPLPTVACHPDIVVCQMAQPFTLVSLGGFTPAGGTFTEGTNPNPITTFDPGTAGNFTHTITYTYVDPSTGCSNFCTFNIFVDAMASVSLEGQVKYWNSTETYMPTPFPTDVYGTTPPDYFYVALYNAFSDEQGTITTLVDVTAPLATAVDWQKVDITQTEKWDPISGTWVIDKDYMSYFKFNTLLDPAKQYFMTVWDGSHLWEEFVTNGSSTGNYPTNQILGASWTWNNWGGVTAIDALAMQYMINHATDMQGLGWTWVGLQNYVAPLDLHYGFYSNPIANVNSVNDITALDALTTQYRIAGLQPTFPNNTPNFRVSGRFVDALPKITWPVPFNNGNKPVDVEFTKSVFNYQYFTPAISHFYRSNNFTTQPFFLAEHLTGPVGQCPDYGYINIYYNATGDVNSNYVPPSAGFKAAPAMNLLVENEIAVQKGQIVTIPVSLDRGAELGSISLGMTFRNDLVKVLEVPGYDVVNIDNEKGIVRVVWADMNGKSVSADEAIVNIKVLVLADITSDTRLFELEAMSELGTVQAQAIEGTNFKTSWPTTRTHSA